MSILKESHCLNPKGPTRDTYLFRHHYSNPNHYICILSFYTVMGQQECLESLRSSKYQGHVSVTNHGYTCQAWASQSPHKHVYSSEANLALFPANETVTEARNYCRDLDIPGRPWCYTMDPHLRWQYCTAVICTGFTETCGGVFHYKSGLIKSPDINRDGWHDPFVDCLWTLQADQDHVIRFEIILYATSPTTGCFSDVLVIFESGTEGYPFYCQASDSVTYGESMSNTLYLQFYSEDVFQAAGFRLAYRQVPASEKKIYIELVSTVGWISPPDEDDDGFYDFNLYCNYHVRGRKGDVIEFQLLHADIEKSVACQYDHLSVLDDVEVLETYCGYLGLQTPGQTATESLYVLFVSDQILVGEGFNLTYRALSSSTPSSKVSNECLDNLFIEPYHGTVHVTNTGHLCQSWARQTPHTHTRTNDADFPYDGSVQEASNYCRDFGEFRGRPFCYTIDPGVRWGYCTFVICNSSNASHVESIQLDKINDMEFINLETPADNYEYLWRLDHPGGVLRYEVLFVDNGGQTECEKYQLLTLHEQSIPHDYKVFCNISSKLLLGETRSSVAYLHMYSDSNTAPAVISVAFKAVNLGNKVSQEFLFNYTGWIASPDYDKDLLYDFNVHYVWKIIAAIPTEVVSVVPFLVDLISYIDETGACSGDKIELMDDLGPLGLLCAHGMSPSLESRGSTLIIGFTSDDIHSATGFNITFEIIRPDLGCIDVLRYSVYPGTINTTNHGRQCLVWKEQTRLQIPATELHKDSSWSRNPCRQFGTSLYPWCYTTDPDLLWEYCTFSVCTDEPANICEHTLTLEPGWITAPGYENIGLYKQNVDCIWKVLAPDHRVIRFRLHFIDIELSNGCVKDHLIIAQGRGTEDISLLCGQTATNGGHGETVANVLYVFFYSDNKVDGRGFNISYSYFAVLDKSFNISIRNSYGRITPPDEDRDGSYDFNVKCVWTVEVDTDYRIYVQLSDIHMIQKNTSCKDNLMMQDDSTTWFQGCNFEGETYSFTAATNRLYVHFNSSFFTKESGLTGFTIVFQQIQDKPKTCLEDLESTRYGGTISVTNHGFDCQPWASLNPNTHTVFTDKYFPLDGSVVNANNYCRDPLGHGRPWCYTTNSSVIYDSCTFRICRDEGSVCGGVIRDEAGFLTAQDTDEDLKYDFNTDCLWIIQTGYGYHVRYKLLSYNLEMSNFCSKDYLKMWGDREQYFLVACGNIEHTKHKTDMFPLEGETLDKTLFVQFYSDRTANFVNGFSLSFRTVTALTVPCGEKLTDKSGRISSPDLDNDGYYDYNADCHWAIEVDSKKAILFHVQYVWTEPFEWQDGIFVTDRDTRSIRAECDRLQIVINNDDRESEVITGCHIDTMEPILIPDNKLDVFFQSDGFMTGKGFNLTYQEQETRHCGGRLNASSGFIVSPDMDEDGTYDRLAECYWLIEADEDHLIEFQLLYLDIKRTYMCYLEELAILDTRLCVKLDIQAPEQTGESRVVVRFHSSFSPEGRGFNMSYKMYNKVTFADEEARSGDYEMVDTPISGWISSQDLDNDGSYDNNQGMRWLFSPVEKGHTTLLQLLYIDTEISENCKSDVLTVNVDGWDNIYFCGTGTKQSIYTRAGKETVVQFLTDNSVGGSGFNMTYRSVRDDNAGCGGILTSPSDFLMSGPSQSCLWTSINQCQWTIQLDPDKVIVFKIMEIHFDKGATCVQDYLKVYEEHREIGTFCGSMITTDITSESNILKVDYQSLHCLSGFQATYVEAENDKSCSSTYRCILSNAEIPRHYLCDDVRDCPNGDDERFCYFRCPEECVCHGLHIDCSGQRSCRTTPTNRGQSTTVKLPSSTRALDISAASETFQNINIQQHGQWFIESLNISRCEIVKFPNGFFKPLIRLKILDLSYNKIKSLTSRLFETQVYLEQFIVDGNFEALTFEADVFFGATSLRYLEMRELYIAKISRMTFSSESLTSLKIYNSILNKIEDHFMEESIIKYLYLNSSKLVSFTRAMFDAASELRILVTDEYKFCCVRPSYLHENNCLPHRDEFSSCNDLIDSDALRILVWILAGVIVIANCFSILNRVREKDNSKHCFGIFSLNLAISDILMGVYLIIIGAVDIMFRGMYIFHDEAWRGNLWCKVASVLSVTACENSALFICLITMDRYLVIKFPFRKQIITPKTGMILSCIIWILGSFAALIPIGFIKGGLYSQTGVCLALPITRAKFDGWGYSFGLFVVFNSIICLSVAFGQWSIYGAIRASAKAVGRNETKSSKASRIARNLLLVSISDFLCRFPVSLLGIVASTGVVAVPASVYSWVVIMVLPINAVVDPLLYTLSAKLHKKKLQQQPEGEKETKIILRDHYENCLDFMRHSSFRQFPGQQSGYKALSEVIQNDSFVVKHRLQVARDVTKLLAYIHERKCVQTDLKPSDVYVNHTHKEQNHVRTVMVCRAKRMGKAREWSKNIGELGRILKMLAQQK